MAPQPLAVWGRPTSSNTQKVLWVCEEAGVGVDLHLASAWLGPGSNLLTEHTGARPYGGTDTPEFRAMNPHGMLPTVRDPNAPGGPVALWESNTIVRYVAAAYAPGLHLGSTAGMGQCSMWMDWTMGSEWYPANDVMVTQVARTPKDRRNLSAVRAANGKYVELFRRLDRQLQRTGAWVAGDAFSIADIPVGVELCRWILAVHAANRDGAGLHVPGFQALPAYWQRLIGRPAFVSQVYRNEAAHQELAVEQPLPLPGTSAARL
eukprot:TRINITY_DN55353_c0_g1_i1.p1 TRINITY_DN55353_c0_g1~~TRINITY_DN55353_c0_g1_i1.p1  ORF type:complete len:263 (+),score=43.19 TRINITY_DN55353_c0_g1_i1:89-877(+)